MTSASTPTRVATPMIVERRNPLNFLFILPIDKCLDLWYNRGVVQRALDGRQGPNFRPANPIWNFFATSSDSHMASNFPENQAPRRADRESAYVETFV